MIDLLLDHVRDCFQKGYRIVQVATPVTAVAEEMVAGGPVFESTLRSLDFAIGFVCISVISIGANG